MVSLQSKISFRVISLVCIVQWLKIGRFYWRLPYQKLDLPSRLYCNPKDSYLRRSTQTVFHLFLKCLHERFAPVMPHLAQELHNELGTIGSNRSVCDAVLSTSSFSRETDNKCERCLPKHVHSCRSVPDDDLSRTGFYNGHCRPFTRYLPWHSSKSTRDSARYRSVFKW